MNLQPGTILQGGKYKIEKILGQGGFGITYLAVAKTSIEGKLGKMEVEVKVAIKEFFMKEVCLREPNTSHISTPSTGNKELVEQYKTKFIKEAKNLASLNHPNIITVTDVFKENNTVYYVMKYIDGGNLQQYVKQKGGLSEKESLYYIRQIASAIDYMHQHKICHFDIKPGNILLETNGNVLLIDFGISKQYDEKGNQTSSTPIGLSTGYAPLEQYNQSLQNFSPVTDIYALGATLFFLLTNTPPPEASVINEEGLPIFSNSIAKQTQYAITKAMEPKRKERIQNITEFLCILDGETDIVVTPTSISKNENENEITEIIPSFTNDTKQKNEAVILKKNKIIYVVLSALIILSTGWYGVTNNFITLNFNMPDFLIGGILGLTVIVISYLWTKASSLLLKLIGIILISIPFIFNFAINIINVHSTIYVYSLSYPNFQLDLLTVILVSFSNGVLLFTTHSLKQKKISIAQLIYVITCLIPIWFMGTYLNYISMSTSLIVSVLIYQTGIWITTDTTPKGNIKDRFKIKDFWVLCYFIFLLLLHYVTSCNALFYPILFTEFEYEDQAGTKGTYSLKIQNRLTTTVDLANYEIIYEDARDTISFYLPAHKLEPNETIEFYADNCWAEKGERHTNFTIDISADPTLELLYQGILVDIVNLPNNIEKRYKRKNTYGWESIK